MEDVERGDAFEILFFVEGEDIVDLTTLHDDAVDNVADARVVIEECRLALSPDFRSYCHPERSLRSEGSRAHSYARDFLICSHVSFGSN